MRHLRLRIERVEGLQYSVSLERWNNTVVFALTDGSDETMRNGETGAFYGDPIFQRRTP